MPDRSTWGGFVKRAARVAGRRFEQAKRAYGEGRTAAETSDLPRTDAGEVKLVCRRYAERRAVALDGQGRPECYEAGHPDCEGCVADVADGRVETW